MGRSPLSLPTRSPAGEGGLIVETDAGHIFGLMFSRDSPDRLE
jgi:hypothetical protein